MRLSLRVQIALMARKFNTVDDLSYPQAPPENEVIIAVRSDNKKDQVEIRNGIAYLWRYKSTDDIFCREDEIKMWRGCTGFDF